MALRSAALGDFQEDGLEEGPRLWNRSCLVQRRSCEGAHRAGAGHQHGLIPQHSPGAMGGDFGFDPLALLEGVEKALAAGGLGHFFTKFSAILCEDLPVSKFCWSCLHGDHARLLDPGEDVDRRGEDGCEIETFGGLVGCLYAVLRRDDAAARSKVRSALGGCLCHLPCLDAQDDVVHWFGPLFHGFSDAGVDLRITRLGSNGLCVAIGMLDIELETLLPNRSTMLSSRDENDLCDIFACFDEPSSQPASHAPDSKKRDAGWLSAHSGRIHFVGTHG
mmetsp:Transcript_49358/g.105021  ORF Transcript_49358/g.105021 Transcript_49358/m.105021 type:complete len:277 (-) Transcript_49358:76-906(-)